MFGSDVVKTPITAIEHLKTAEILFPTVILDSDGALTPQLHFQITTAQILVMWRPWSHLVQT